MTSGILVEDQKKLTHVRANTLPENACYRDDGCDVSPSCFSCHLPMCKFDDPGWFQRENRRERDIRIIRDRSEKGFDVPELANRFGVSTRTVHRVLQTGKATRSTQFNDDGGPTISVLELSQKSLFKRPMPLPKLLGVSEQGRSARKWASGIRI